MFNVSDQSLQNMDSYLNNAFHFKTYKDPVSLSAHRDPLVSLDLLEESAHLAQL